MADTTIRYSVFNAINSLFVANKPTYSYDGTTYTYNIKSAYPEENPTFPIIVINPAMISVKLLAIGQHAATRINEIEVEIEFYAKAEHGKKAIDQARDSIQNLILSSESTLVGNDLYLSEDVFDDSNVDIMIEGDEKINTAGMIIKFHLK